jgi:cell wall-associated NlpC family hydrolase
VERARAVQHSRPRARRPRGGAGGHRGKSASRWAAGRLATAIGIATAVGLLLPSSTAVAGQGSPVPPSLKALLARATKLSYQIDALSQQYDALRIQLAGAKTQVKVALATMRADERMLASAQRSIAQIAAAGYMTQGTSPTLQLLQSNNPQMMLNRAAILAELQVQNRDKINLVRTARAAAGRARLLAIEEERHAAKLSAAMQHKVALIQQKENVLNSAAFAQAMAIFQKTGSYPNIKVAGNSVGVQALRYGLTRVGYPYAWGAAGPTAFDCSGLVVWAYAQIGISLPHFTGDLWNSGVHVSRAQLQPGDLIFFFADLGHVGIYMGNNMMLDAPTFGIPVGVHQIFWSAYMGAVRIA